MRKPIIALGLSTLALSAFAQEGVLPNPRPIDVAKEAQEVAPLSRYPVTNLKAGAKISLRKEIFFDRDGNPTQMKAPSAKTPNETPKAVFGTIYMAEPSVDQFCEENMKGVLVRGAFSDSVQGKDVKTLKSTVKSLNATPVLSAKTNTFAWSSDFIKVRDGKVATYKKCLADLEKSTSKVVEIDGEKNKIMVEWAKRIKASLDATIARNESAAHCSLALSEKMEKGVTSYQFQVDLDLALTAPPKKEKHGITSFKFSDANFSRMECSYVDSIEELKNLFRMGDESKLAYTETAPIPTEAESVVPTVKVWTPGSVKEKDISNTKEKDRRIGTESTEPAGKKPAEGAKDSGKIF